MRLTLHQAAKELNSGHVVAVPTETVYGLAASLDHPRAIESIFALKSRPRDNPLIIHLAEREMIDRFALNYPPHFDELADAFWPGPLTLILPIKDDVPASVCAGLSTGAFRIPALDLTRSLLKLTGPLVMPSANLSGRPSATCPEHVEEDFGAFFPVLDGGVCMKGLESTILLHRESEWVITRLGVLSPEAFLPILGYTPRSIGFKGSGTPLSPGQRYRHYAPIARLWLGGSIHSSISCIIGFKECSYPPNKRVFYLGSLGNPEEVASNLYQTLRQIDAEGISDAWVDMDFPRTGLWLTIAERLTKAGERM